MPPEHTNTKATVKKDDGANDGECKRRNMK